MSVRNLRAMFESRKQESPPDRGRSPGESSAGTDSPRPLSKVRTSFVAIEKDGRIGLQRNPSEASSLSGRKLSGDTEATSSVQLDNTSTNVSSPTTSRPEFIRGPASAISISSAPQDSGNPPAGGDTTSTNPSDPQDPVPRGPGGAAIANTGKQAVLAESPQIKQGIGRDRESEGLGNSGSRRPEPAGETSEGQVAPDIAQSEAGTGSEGVNEGGNKDPAGGSASRGTSGGAEVTKILNGVDKTKVTKPAAGTARKTANAQPVKSSTPASQSKPAGKPSETAARRSTTPNAERKTAEKKPTKKLASTHVSPEGLAKPRSKSSTRPAKIPASLTSHTTASGSRSRATSGNGPPSAHANTGRPTSRTSTTSGTANKGVRRSASAVGRQRPSIGPPPKLPAKDHPVPKKESRVDESFLARMTRPTQSYANKVSDKVPITPPRRSASATRKPASAKSGTSRKPTSRATSAAPSAAASPENDRKVDYSAANNISPVVEQTPPPTAEESVTKKAESGGLSINKEKEAIPEPPKTPERQPTILEEKEEAEALLADAVPAVASAAPRLPKEPDVEAADVPLADGEHE